jgi:hypothetical protein
VSTPAPSHAVAAAAGDFLQFQEASPSARNPQRQEKFSEAGSRFRLQFQVDQLACLDGGQPEGDPMPPRSLPR